MKKQRYNSKKIIINSTLSLALIAAGLFSIQPIQNAYADKSIDQLTNEINALQSQIDDAQSQANNLSEKTKTLQSELEGIAKERSVIESQIKISQGNNAIGKTATKKLPTAAESSLMDQLRKAGFIGGANLQD